MNEPNQTTSWSRWLFIGATCIFVVLAHQAHIRTRYRTAERVAQSRISLDKKSRHEINKQFAYIAARDDAIIRLMWPSGATTSPAYNATSVQESQPGLYRISSFIELRIGDRQPQRRNYEYLIRSDDSEDFLNLSIIEQHIDGHLPGQQPEEAEQVGGCDGEKPPS